MDRFLELTSYIVTAAATAALAYYAFVQSKALNQEKAERAGRFDALARYYAMLVRRSLREAVRALDDNDIGRDPALWRHAMEMTSASFREVERNLQAMLQAAVQRRGGTGKEIEEIADRFYSAADSFNELADKGLAMSVAVIKQHLDNARKTSIVCWQGMERLFGLEPQQPHSFEEPSQPARTQISAQPDNPQPPPPRPA